MPKRNPQKKIVIFGEGGVGKTSITTRFMDQKLRGDYKMTIGVDFGVKQNFELVENDKVDLQIWDMGGQGRFAFSRDTEQADAKQVKSSYYDGANCLLMVYDMTSIETMNKLFDDWLPKVLKRIAYRQSIGKATGMPPIVVLANKVDAPKANCGYDDFKAKFEAFKKPYGAKGKNFKVDFYYTSAWTDQQIKAAITLAAGRTVYSGDKFKKLIETVTPKKHEDVTPAELSEMIDLLSDEPTREIEDVVAPFYELITSDMSEYIKEYGSEAMGVAQSDEEYASTKEMVVAKISSMEKKDLKEYFSPKSYTELTRKLGLLVEGQYFLAV